MVEKKKYTPTKPGFKRSTVTKIKTKTKLPPITSNKKSFISKNRDTTGSTTLSNNKKTNDNNKNSYNNIKVNTKSTTTTTTSTAVNTSINNNNSNNNSSSTDKPKYVKTFHKSVENTVFIRFVTGSGGNDDTNAFQNLRRHHVEDLFSQIGPVKKSSLILPKKITLSDDNPNNHQNNNNQRCYGFVKYMSNTDAELASIQLNNKTIYTDQYSPPIIVKVELAKNVHNNTATTDTAAAAAASETTNKEKEENANIEYEVNDTVDSKKNNNLKMSTKVTKNNKTNNTVVETTQDQKKPLSLATTTTTNIVPATPPASTTATTIPVVPKKNLRLIIRNLSFYAKEKDIRDVFETKYGPLIELHIPIVNTTTASISVKNEDNDSNNKKFVKQQHRGFCFITFLHDKDAQKCLLEQENNKTSSMSVTIKDRVVTISKAMSKSNYETKLQQPVVPKIVPDKTIAPATTTTDNTKIKFDTDNDVNSIENHNDNDDERSIKDNEDDESSSSSSDDDDDKDDNDNDAHMNIADDDDDDNDDNEKAVNRKSKNNSSDNTNTNTKDVTAVQERRCLFIRNIPFDATRYDLFTLLRTYGHITSLYLVKDKATNIPVGSAFVSYETSQQALSVLHSSNNTATATATDTDLETTIDDSHVTTTTEDDTLTTTNFKSQRNNFMSNKTNSVGTNVNSAGTGTGIMLKGRALLIDLAVDKETAHALSVTVDDNVKGQDRRNLYLLTEGRVENNTQKGTTDWDDIPDSDQLKRQTAWSEKHMKLKSPLFFINPVRLSIRNIAKHIDDKELKALCATAIVNGLTKKLVTTQDLISHWRATGTISTREILHKLQQAEQEQSLLGDGDNIVDKDMLLIPSFDSSNIKQYIPSVYISRDVTRGGSTTSSSAPPGSTTTTTTAKELSPSRGFGFIEFTHHIHALVCLRELNNNIEYSENYATGGKRAIHEMIRSEQIKRHAHQVKGQAGQKSNNNTTTKIPRLIVDFAVENKAKAKQQLEHRLQQQANMVKNKVQQQQQQSKINNNKNNNINNNSNNKKSNSGIDKSNTDNTNDNNKKKGRGALQRERKRKAREMKNGNNTSDATTVAATTNNDNNNNKRVRKNEALDDTTTILSSSVPGVGGRDDSMYNDNEDDALIAESTSMTFSKKKRGSSSNNNNSHNMDKEEEHFTKLVESYKEQFMNTVLLKNTNSSSAAAQSSAMDNNSNRNDTEKNDNPKKHQSIKKESIMKTDTTQILTKKKSEKKRWFQ